MRFVKASLFGLMVLVMWAMWANRGYVADSYAIKPNNLEIRLNGVDLEVERTEIGASPFNVPAAPDTRRKPLSLLFTANTPAEPVTVAMTGGEARLVGTAMGPDGPAFGGTVRIERHTTDGLASIDARVGSGGSWSAEGLPGGRYRIRAWVPGRLTMTTSEVLFVEADETVRLDFKLEEVDPEPTLEFVHAGPIYLGYTGQVAVAVSQRVVDADGLILTTPVVGALITLQTTSEVTAISGAAQLTGPDGAARFVLRCNRNGSGNAVARYGAIGSFFALPGCRPVPPPPTTQPPVPSTQADGPTGSSTSGSNPSTTTPAKPAATTGLSTNTTTKGSGGNG